MGLGSLAGGVIYERISPQIPFLTMIVLAIPSFFLTLYLVKESEKREK
jgi:predicted MFS family arabinose efflux permease